VSRRRYLSTDISTDRRVNQMGMKYGDGPVLFYTWLIPHCEDDGTITADPWELLGIVWAARRDKTEDDVRQAIAACEEFGLLERSADGRRLQMPVDAWLRYQTYIPTAKREAILARRQGAVPNTDNHRDTPQITDEDRATPTNAEEPRTPAQNTASPSPSLSPSPSPSPSPLPPPSGDLTCPNGAAGSDAAVPVAAHAARRVKDTLPGYAPEFEQAWRVYPKHAEKRAAYNQWLARVREGVDPQVLYEAARRYAQAVADRPARFVKYAKTFWGQTRPYEDYLPGATGPPPAADEPLGWRGIRAWLAEHPEDDPAATIPPEGG
jgi:hypothetical protein